MHLKTCFGRYHRNFTHQLTDYQLKTGLVQYSDCDCMHNTAVIFLVRQLLLPVNVNCLHYGFFLAAVACVTGFLSPRRKNEEKVGGAKTRKK